MRPLLLFLISLALSFPASATITESHGYAQFGTLKYPAMTRKVPPLGAAGFTQS